MNVAFSLRRRPSGHPAVAAWLPGRDVAALLGLCSRLGLDPTGRVFGAAGGFLVRLAEPSTAPLPGAVRLRALADDLLLPADAELVPALLDDEAAGLVRGRGLVFLPDGRAAGFDPGEPLPLPSLLAARVLPRRDWQPFPRRLPLAERIEEIAVDLPGDSPDAVLDAAAGGGVGAEPPRPPEAGAASTLLGKAALGLGRGAARLGEALGWDRLAAAGSGWVDRALRIAPRLSEDLIGRQAAALQDLLRQFRSGDVEDALRHALPLGTPGESRGAAPFAGDALPPRDLTYGLRGLLAGDGPGPAGAWVGGQDVIAELTREYRKAAEQALRRGDYRRAAAIYGKLLRDFRSAAHALLRGGLHHDAAVLFLARLDDPRAAARAFEAAGEVDRAVQLYRQVGEHEAAGDLLRRAGEDEAALAEYRTAADRLGGSASGDLAAGNLLLNKAGRPDLARAFYASGWSRRPGGNAVSCALALARLDAAGGDAAAVLALVGQADALFAATFDVVEAGRFYNELAELAGRRELQAARDELRDRALLGLANQLRARGGTGARGGAVVSNLLGARGGWPAAVVSDAGFAVAAAARRPQAGPGVRRLRVFDGAVSAVAEASGSGEVFLGFESGEVYAFRPGRSEVAHVATYDLPVTSLAADPLGTRLVVLRELGSMTAAVSSYERQGDGSYRLLHGARCEEVAVAGAWLTPVLETDDEPLVGLWTGLLLQVVTVDTLSPWWSLPYPGPEADPPAGVLLADDHGTGLKYALLHDGKQWALVDGPGEFRKGTGLYWRPAAAEGSPLRSTPLSWAAFAPGNLDVAGLGPSGTLHWGRFEDGELVATNTATANAVSGGYLAAAVVRDGLVAGVTPTRVEWLRCGAGKFLPWRTTDLAVRNVVAGFTSRPTGELIVVSSDGFVVGVPVPS